MVTGPGSFNNNVRFNAYQPVQRNTPLNGASSPAASSGVFSNPAFDSVSFSATPKFGAKAGVQPAFDIHNAINDVSKMSRFDAADQLQNPHVRNRLEFMS